MKITALLALACLLELSSCKKAEHYRLTNEQLAWQPYKTGDILRFGHRLGSSIRTYRITSVSDQMVTLRCQALGGDCDDFQWITVNAERIDPISYYRPDPAKPDSLPVPYDFALLNMDLSNQNGVPPFLQADVKWGDANLGVLPLDDAITGTPLRFPGSPIADTAAHLLPSVVLGTTTYGPTLKLNLSTEVYHSTALNPISQLYYAKNNGVVAFRDGQTLWYRVP